MQSLISSVHRGSSYLGNSNLSLRSTASSLPFKLSIVSNSSQRTKYVSANLFTRTWMAVVALSSNSIIKINLTIITESTSSVNRLVFGMLVNLRNYLKLLLCSYYHTCFQQEWQEHCYCSNYSQPLLGPSV